MKTLLTALVLVGVLGFSSQASAHANSVTGIATCGDNLYKVVWTITNDFNLTEDAHYSHTTPTVSDQFVQIPAGNGQTGLVEETYLGDQTGGIQLNVKGVWSDNFSQTSHGSVTLNGECLDIPQIMDVCTNIEGVQETVPEGFTESDGVCTETPPEDVCPDIEGVQTSQEDCAPQTTEVPPNNKRGGGSHHHHSNIVKEPIGGEVEGTSTISIPLSALPETGYRWEDLFRDILTFFFG